MKYQLHISIPSEEWEPLKIECFDSLVLAIGRAKILISETESTMIAVAEDLGPHIIKFISGSEEPYYTHPDYTPEVLAALGYIPETIADKVIADRCPDCKDGFYIPFVGPKEPCQTCSSNV